MKHILIIISILLLSSPLFGQCTRTKQLGTSSKDYGTSVTTDSSGNIYVTGYTEGGLDGNTNSGESDIFLVKYNSSGTKQWTKQLGTSYLDEGYSVTTDSLDNIYVTGWTNWRFRWKYKFRWKRYFPIEIQFIWYKTMD